jgi:hypothetical protein
MPALLRSYRGFSAVVVALALTTTASAQPADDPIAASNRMTDPWVAPKPVLTPVEAPWLTPAEPKGKAMLTRITTPVVEPRVTETPAAPPAVVWSTPVRRPIESAMPMPERPMMPCEPFVASPTPKPTTALAQGEPPPCTESVALEKPVAVIQASGEQPASRTEVIRFVDDARPATSDRSEVMAMIRRGGGARARVSDVRAAVEQVCHGRVLECQTEVAGEMQLRVVLTVRSTDDWEGLYERLELLPDIGEYGLLLQVHVKK